MAGGRVARAFVVALGALTAPACAADDIFDRMGGERQVSGAPRRSRRRIWPGSRSGSRPGAITYWRDPGDAGVPPTFDFAGSDNVANVEPVFPLPSGSPNPDGSEAFGYERGVILPLADRASRSGEACRRWRFTPITRCAKRSACRRRRA